MRSLLCRLTIVFSLLFATTIVYAQPKNVSGYQRTYSSRRDPLVGLHFIETKFNNSASGKYNAGYQLSYLDGIGGKYDYMIQLGSTSTNTPLRKDDTEKKDMLHNIQASIMRRFLQDSVRINPFVSVSLGGNLYGGSVTPTAAIGGGVQLKLGKNIFLFTQVNHYWNVQINNSWQANIGLMGTIFHRKKKSIVTVQTLLAVTDIDSDGDGIMDKNDSCPNIPGSIAFHGCPDTDGDGIPDNLDSCVTVPGFSAYKGCPSPVIVNNAVVKVDTVKGVISQNISTQLSTIASNIKFEFNKALLTDSSEELLKEVVVLLKEHPSYLLVINGHTDNVGNEKSNKILSVQRANAVKDYLVAHGIDSSRLTAEGFGAAKPVADNSTEEGRKQNRRTEFVLKQL